MTKYHARPTEAWGFRFDSAAEARRYGELRLLHAAGEISAVLVHPRFDLVVNDRNVGVYEADFQYVDLRTDAMVLEDVKGVRTPVYRLKKKLMLALYGIEITEIEA